MDRGDGKKSQGRLNFTRNEIFCCDLDTLVNLRDAKLLGKLRVLVREERAKIPEGVNREARRKTDRLAKTVENWQKKYGFIVDLDYEALAILPKLEQKYGPPFSIGGKKYPGFWKSPSGRKSVDAQVVALAKSRGWIVVSNDDSVHGACMLEDVGCRRWEEIGRILLGPQQLSLWNASPPSLP